VLILKRRRGETVNIGPDVVITVVETSQNWVTLGIAAPIAWPIGRASVRLEPISYPDEQSEGRTRTATTSLELP